MKIIIVDSDRNLNVGILADILERHGSETEIIVAHSMEEARPHFQTPIETMPIEALKVDFEEVIARGYYENEFKKPDFKGHERPYKYHK